MKVIFTLVFLIWASTHQALATQNISVSPSILELKQSSGSDITISNRSDTVNTINYQFRYLKSDAYGMLVPLDILNNPTGIQVTGTDSGALVQLNPNSSRNITVSYTPTTDIEDSLIGIEFITTAKEVPENRTASAVESSIIVPLILSSSEAKITNSDIKLEVPFIITGNKAPFGIRIANTEGNPVKIEGSLVIRNIFYQTVTTLDIPLQYVLQDQERYILGANGENISWNPALLIGFYQAELIIENDNNKISKSTYFIGMPFMHTIVLVIISLIMSGIYLRVRKYR